MPRPEIPVPDQQPVSPAMLIESVAPLRVWSLIVTIFGDAVMDQGRLLTPPDLPTASLMALLARIGIEPGPARTSLSRLVAGGTLIRTKAGRNTFYRLSAASAEEFAAASRVIYTAGRPAATGAFHLALIDRCADRAAARHALEAEGFRFIGPATAILPARAGLTPALPQGAIPAEAQTGPDLRHAAREVWQIEAVDTGYRHFLAAFAPWIAEPARLAPDQAIALRIAATHAFRRLALRDPDLPANVLPEGWAGAAARQAFDRLTRGLRPASEGWLAAHGFRG